MLTEEYIKLVEIDENTKQMKYPKEVEGEKNTEV